MHLFYGSVIIIKGEIMEIFLLITAIICICFIVWLQYFKIRQKKKDIKRRGELGEKIIATILDVNGGKILNNYIILERSFWRSSCIFQAL